ncbi:FUSC family protein [Thiotrichales bacterium 19S9-12]|nr:FUSC family protein [Thiotrichales bacterium 19S9-11]MCF6811316.1 FUSC family protein [Thiotrichales bacterium 19S9-12]
MAEIKYFTFIRYIQISLALTVAVLISIYFSLDHGYWIPMTVMIMYGPFEEGTVAVRIKDRMFGTILGLLFGIVIVGTFQISNVLLYTIPLIIFIITYFMLNNYVITSTFITLLVVLVFALASPRNISPAQFGIARLIDTLIAAIICISFESLFRLANLTKKTIEVAIINSLKAYSKHLVNVLESMTSDQILSFDSVDAFNEAVMQFQKQINLSNFRFYKAAYDQNKINKIEQILHNIRYNLALLHYLSRYHHPILCALYKKNQFIFDQLIDQYKEASEKGKLPSKNEKNKLIQFDLDQSSELEHLFTDTAYTIHQLLTQVWQCSIER